MTLTLILTIFFDYFLFLGLTQAEYFRLVRDKEVYPFCCVPCGGSVPPPAPTRKARGTVRVAVVAEQGVPVRKRQRRQPFSIPTPEPEPVPPTPLPANEEHLALIAEPVPPTPLPANEEHLALIAEPVLPTPYATGSPTNRLSYPFLSPYFSSTGVDHSEKILEDEEDFIFKPHSNEETHSHAPKTGIETRVLFYRDGKAAALQEKFRAPQEIVDDLLRHREDLPGTHLPDIQNLKKAINGAKAKA